MKSLCLRLLLLALAHVCARKSKSQTDNDRGVAMRVIGLDATAAAFISR